MFLVPDECRHEFQEELIDTKGKRKLIGQGSAVKSISFVSWLSKAKLGRGHDVRKSQFSATVIYGKNSAIIKITSRGLLLHKLGRGRDFSCRKLARKEIPV